MIKVLFFAQLREQLGCHSLEVSENNIHCVADLRQFLVASHPHWENFLNNGKLMVAVNQTLVKVDQALAQNDEVAFFPPVTGG